MRKFARPARFALLWLAFACMARAAFTDEGVLYSSGSSGISVTQTNTATSLTNNHSGGDSAAFKARWLMVRSRAASANTCYFDYLDTVASTADIALAPGASIVIQVNTNPALGISGFGAICASGQTATFDVTAAR